MRIKATLLLGAVLLGLAACAGEELDTRTFQVRYLRPHQVEQLVTPYVFMDREGAPGQLSAGESAITVRETPDNLDKIERVLAEYDRPRPTVTLQFQIIEADGAATGDPAIADVEKELRRLFRFEGYELVAETQVSGIQTTNVRQLVGGGRGESERGFLIEAQIAEVRGAAGDATVTLFVTLTAMGVGEVLQTTVTIPAGHSVVLGTAKAPSYEGALILVVRADLIDGEPRVPS